MSFIGHRQNKQQPKGKMYTQEEVLEIVRGQDAYYAEIIEELKKLIPTEKSEQLVEEEVKEEKLEE